MKSSVLISALATALLSWLAAPLSAQQVRVFGTVASEDSLQVIASRLMLSSAQPSGLQQYTLPGDDFELVMETDAPVYLGMRGQSVRFPPLLLEPGADVRLTVSQDGAIEVTGPGSAGPAYLIHHNPQDQWRPVLQETYRSLQETEGEVDFEAYMTRMDSVLEARNAAVAEAGLSPLYTRVLQAENFANSVRTRNYAREYMEPHASDSVALKMLRRALALPGGDTLAYAMRYTEALRNLLYDRYNGIVSELGGTASLPGHYYFQKAVAPAPLLRLVLTASVVDNMLRGEDYDAELTALVDDFTRSAGDGPYRVYIEGRANQRQATAPGEPAPDLAAVTLEGDSITIEDLRGEVVLVTTWGSWCGWSKAELPWLNLVSERLADEEVVFVNFGWDEDASDWREAVEAYDLRGVNILTDEALRRAWGLAKTPTFILLDRDGSIITYDPPRPSVHEGAALEAMIRDALSGG